MKKVTVSYEMTRVYGVIDGNFTDETVERTVGFLLDDAAAAQLGGVHTPYDSNNCTSEERYLLQAIVALSHLSSSYFIATYRGGGRVMHPPNFPRPPPCSPDRIHNSYVEVRNL